MGKIADLYADVGFKFDSVKLREVSKYIGDINVSSLIATTSLVGLGIGIKGLVDQSAALSNNLNILSTTTGIDPQFIQKLEHAAFVLGSSKEVADQWIASLSSLQQKLTVAQGDQRFFTAAQMLGVDSVGFNKIIGNTEELAKAVIRILSTPFDKVKGRVSQEQFARTKTWLAGLINVPPDLLTAFNNPHFAQEFNSFEGLSNADIKQNIESTRQWREVVDTVNMAFLKMVQTTLPELTAAVKGFVQDGGLKDTLQLIKDAGETLYKIDLLGGIVGTKIRTAFLNASNTEKQVELDDQRLKISQAKSINVSVAPITITTNNPQEFGKKFQDEFTKVLEIATRQSSLGQT